MEYIAYILGIISLGLGVLCAFAGYEPKLLWITLAYTCFVLVLTAFYFTERDWKSKSAKFFFKKPLGIGLWLHPLLLIVAATAIPLAENGTGQFKTFIDAFVRMLLPFIPVYGWEAGGPSTDTGIFIASIMTIEFLTNAILNIGTGLTPTLLKIFRGRMKMEYENHFIIWGGPSHIDEIVKQLTNKALGDERRDIVILSEKSFLDEVKNMVQEYESGDYKITVIEGSAQVRKNLVDINAGRAKSIILLPPEDEPKPQLSLLSAATIVNEVLSEQPLDKKPAVIVKVDSPILIEPLRKFADKVICSSVREYLLLGEAALNPNIVDIYNNLMTISEDTNEFYFEKIPQKWAGKDYIELASHILKKTHDSDNPVMLVGIEREGKVYLNPTAKSIGKLKDGDKVIAMAYRCIGGGDIFD